MASPNTGAIDIATVNGVSTPSPLPPSGAVVSWTAPGNLHGPGTTTITGAAATKFSEYIDMTFAAVTTPNFASARIEKVELKLQSLTSNNALIKVYFGKAGAMGDFGLVNGAQSDVWLEASAGVAASPFVSRSTFVSAITAANLVAGLVAKLQIENTEPTDPADFGLDSLQIRVTYTMPGHSQPFVMVLNIDDLLDLADESL